MTQYVTVNMGGKSVYTYRHEGKKVQAGDQVIVDSNYSGARPADVVATSNQPPSKKPAPDGFRGSAKSKTLR